MIYSIALVLLVLWLVGVVAGFLLSGFIHLLLVIAMGMILIGVISRRESAVNKTVLAFILLVAGTVIVAFSGRSFNAHGRPVDFLGLHVLTPGSPLISLVLGALILAAGFLLLIRKPRRT